MLIDASPSPAQQNPIFNTNKEDEVLLNEN